MPIRMGPAGRGGARRRTRRRGNRRHAAEDAQNDQQQQATPAPAATPAQSPTEQLQQLGELHKEGIITDQEFEEKKKELLAQI